MMTDKNDIIRTLDALANWQGSLSLTDKERVALTFAVEYIKKGAERPHGECRTCKHFVRGGLDGKTYVCEHPDILLDDYFDYACITMDADDFCSRYEKEEGEQNEAN